MTTLAPSFLPSALMSTEAVIENNFNTRVQLHLPMFLTDTERFSDVHLAEISGPASIGLQLI